jgi:hypothetical protein
MSVHKSYNFTWKLIAIPDILLTVVINSFSQLWQVWLFADNFQEVENKII